MFDRDIIDPNGQLFIAILTFRRLFPVFIVRKPMINVSGGHCSRETHFSTVFQLLGRRQWLTGWAHDSSWSSHHSSIGPPRCVRIFEPQFRMARESNWLCLMIVVHCSRISSLSPIISSEHGSCVTDTPSQTRVSKSSGTFDISHEQKSYLRCIPISKNNSNIGQLGYPPVIEHGVLENPPYLVRWFS